MKMFGVLGSLGLFLGVALGAFGAHALKARLSPDLMTVFETGVRYQIYHSLALLLVQVFVRSAPVFGLAGWFYVAGIILFSFSLYALALTGTRSFGAITPIGGLCFLVGHLILLYAFVRMQTSF